MRVSLLDYLTMGTRCGHIDAAVITRPTAAVIID